MDTSSPSSSPAPAATDTVQQTQQQPLQPILDNTEAQQLLTVAANRVWEELYVCKKPVSIYSPLF